MKKIYLTLFAVAGMASSAQAVTVQTGIGFNVGINTLDAFSSAVVTTSYQFAVGTFATEPAADAPLTVAWAAFSEFTRATVAANAAGGKIVAPGNGAIAATASAANAEKFNTKVAYMFIGNGATLEASTQYAVIKGSTLTWTFPADTTGAASFNAIASNFGAITTVVGTKIDNATGADSLRLVGIPEPTSMVLLVGSLALGLRRRR
jgi:hypothetical protein